MRVQVLTQCREELIDRTFKSIEGCSQAIVHIYNSTSTLQRDVVFGFDQDACEKLAVDGARLIKEYIDSAYTDTNFILEYSPESYSSTEPEFAVRICDAVCDVWKQGPLYRRTATKRPYR